MNETVNLFHYIFIHKGSWSNTH